MRYRFLLGPVLLLAACGGAIDNSSLYKKDDGAGSSSGASSGSTPAPTATTTSLPPPVPTSSPVPTQCAFSFVNAILPLFARNGCGATTCHDGFIEPRIDFDFDPAGTYKRLLEFTLSTGQRYLVPNTSTAKASGMSCNLRGTCGVAMPPQRKLTPNELDVVDSWLACGAILN